MSDEEKTTQEEEAKALDSFLDHQKKAVDEVGKALSSLVPQAFREHGQSAVKEAVEGYRQLFNKAIDEALETLEKAKLQDKDKKSE